MTKNDYLISCCTSTDLMKKKNQFQITFSMLKSEHANKIFTCKQIYSAMINNSFELLAFQCLLA